MPDPNKPTRRYLLPPPIKKKPTRRRENEPRFRSLFENMLNGFAYCRMLYDGDTPQDFIYLEVNRAFEDLTGLKGATGKRVSELIPGIRESDPQLFEIYSRVARSGLPESFETYVEALQMWFSVSVYSSRQDYFVAVFDMINERKQMEASLRESEEKYRELFMQMENGAATHQLVSDALGRAVDYITLDVNPAYEAFLGVKRADVIGKKASEILPPEELQKWVGIFGPVAQTGVGAHYEMFSPLNQKHFEGSAFCMEPGKFAVTFIDVTERKQAEEKLRASEQEFHSLAEAMPQIVWITRPDGWNIYFNQQWVAYTGLTLEESYGQGWIKPFHPDDQARAWQAWQNATHHGAEYRLECRLRRADGVYQWWLIRGVPLKDEHGQVLKWFGTCTDIHEIKLAQDQIQQLNLSLEQRVELRTHELHAAQEELLRKEKLAVLGQLAGSVGHELRNPLGVISNSVYYLNLVQPQASEKVRSHLAIIAEETQRAAKIVGDLLDFARLSPLERRPVSVTLLVAKTLERFPLPAWVELQLDLPQDLPLVFVDEQQVQQVLGNLLVNGWQAMKAPDHLPGSPATGARLTIRAAYQEQPGGLAQLAIQVSDNGAGIPPENLDKVFDPLFSTKTQGIGLGLAVSKKLAEANGGRIELESRLGQGSTFTLYLPLVGSGSSEAQ